MCGIAGLVNYRDTFDADKIKLALRHRGPDDQTLYSSKNVILIHTRLAIQDLQNGIQPFHFKNYSIIFNGEIYNHKILRKLLPEFEFLTQSDTETLLYLFIKYKYKMFDLLDGMFAFCILDKDDNKLILARDRAGKKPLYYYKNNNIFIFSSELNALKAIATLQIDEDAINCYLRAGFIWKPQTAYKNVLELDSGSYMILNLDNCIPNIFSYFNLIDSYSTSKVNDLNFSENLLKVENILRNSIHARLEASDVEAGVFLSGGIDSSLIAALAAQIKPKIKTFTVKFNGLYDESYLARLTAQRYQTDHIELNINENLAYDIEKILCSYGEPFMDSSAIPSYYVSREARKYVKVVLSGDGADELFGGYRRYVPISYSLSRYSSLFKYFLRYLPHPKNKKSIYNYLYRLLAMSNKKNIDLYLSSTSDIYEDVLPIEDNALIFKLNTFLKSVFENKSLSKLNQMLYADFEILLFCDLLVKMDIASMANSIEVRSPFLAKEILEFAPTIPGKYKINKFKTKYILRKLAEKYLSPILINQPKRGFEVPLKNWIDVDLNETIRSHLQKGSYSENFIDRVHIDNLLTNKMNVSHEKRAKMIWSMYCLEVWHKNEISPK